VLVVPLLLSVDRYVRQPARVFALSALCGLLDASANLAFLLASRHGLLSLAGVITALYPAGTVLLAMAILKERTGSMQRAGLAMAACAVVLLTR
jgi:drug/metabolite transporter (DMT)-like permease